MYEIEHLKTVNQPYLLSAKGNSVKLFVESHLRKHHKRIFLLDGEYMQDWNGFSKAFSNCFSFPEYYGDNWDAFFDLIADLSWLELKEIVVVIANSHKIFRREKKNIEIFQTCIVDTGEFWKDPANNGGWEEDVPTPFHVILHSSEKIVGFNAPLLKI